MTTLIRTRRSASPTAADPELERYHAIVKIDRHDLDNTAEEQAQHFLDICDKRTQALSLRDEAKEALTRIDAEIASGIRRNAKEKMTEGAIYDQVVQTQKHIDATTDYDSKKRSAEFWGNLCSSFEMRAKMIHELTQQYSSGYFTVQSSVQARRSGAQEGRVALHQARTTKG